jgi:hypothetical protein
MKRVNQLLVLAIVAVLLVPSFVFGALVEACCGVYPTELTVEDSPDPACVGAEVTISGTYTVDGWVVGYDTGVDIRVWDPDGVKIVDETLTLGTGEQEVPKDFAFSDPLTVEKDGTYTYEVVAWSVVDGGRMEVWFVGGTITVECCGVCPTIDPCVEYRIRERWKAECPSCDEAKNHGAYVSCRAKIVSEYVEAGLVDEEGSSCLINPEARTDCGKKQ